jgi:acetylornithine deacetylase/succinyl-diaminopimelate desuccinylase-like protein
MSTYLLCLQEIDRTCFMAVGGKGANLGELSRIEGIQVPEGFCVTTEAYKKITESNQELNSLLDELTRLKPEERSTISEISAKIRVAIERIPISKDITEEIAGYLTKFGEKDAFAVRSSATAEDLPTASFAGQQDTYLNIIGKEAILQHISKCWADPALTDKRIQSLIEQAVHESTLSTLTLPSGASHDAQDMARIAPMGMIFVPSKGGISHSPLEYTAPQDMANGASVLFRTLLKVDRTTL